MGLSVEYYDVICCVYIFSIFQDKMERVIMEPTGLMLKYSLVCQQLNKGLDLGHSTCEGILLYASEILSRVDLVEVNHGLSKHETSSIW